MESLTHLAAALAYAAGVEKPACAEEASEELVAYIDESLGGKKADRVFLYNPDAVAYWMQQKYPNLMPCTKSIAGIAIPFQTMLPAVTPVCFGTFYTGAEPKVHGIMKYEKPVIKIDTLFDSMIRAGKKCLIIAHGECSMGKIFREREMDYIVLKSIEEVNAAAVEAILEDQYDFMCVYNGNFDSMMHKYGPESPEAFGALRQNDSVFGTFYDLISRHWTKHNVFMGFAMDHGCHARYKIKPDGSVSLGDHGADIPVDREICHYYRGIPAEEA
ncbi:MAG: alkaline phosphatase family protein [Lachnospiraceae bacterium]|nr:alkaline phosphatase family protein [Lachnospiraceae bacterium]